MERVELSGVHLSSLGDIAFRGCNDLTSMTATSPCTISIIGSSFLASTPKLSSFNFNNISTTTLGECVLQQSGIVSLDLGGLQLKSLGYGAFQDCRSLTSVTATSPCTLGVVGSSFLAYTPKLSSLSFGNISMTTLGDYALYQSAIVELDLGGLQLCHVGSHAFQHCHDLTSVSATSPCTLGLVRRNFLANTPKLLTFSFHNISFHFIDTGLLEGSGVVEVDVGGVGEATICDTRCPQLRRVIATAPTTVKRFAGKSVEPQHGGSAPRRCVTS